MPTPAPALIVTALPSVPALLVTVLPSVPARHATIHVAGEMDLDSVAPLRQALRHCLQTGIRTIDIDARGVTFCDVSGLNLLLAAANRTASAGGALTVRCPSPSVARLLELTATTAYLIPAPGPPPGAAGRALSSAAGYTS
ncbi:STAS domain-containing protein [Kitasatospora sp. NPDC054939]